MPIDFLKTWVRNVLKDQKKPAEAIGENQNANQNNRTMLRTIFGVLMILGGAFIISKVPTWQMKLAGLAVIIVGIVLIEID